MSSHVLIGPTELGWRSRLLAGATRLLVRAWLATALAVGLVAAVVHFELVTADDLGPLAAGPSVSTGEEAGSTMAGDLGAYPSLRYAGLEVAIVEARAVPVNRTGRPIVVVELATRNTTDRQFRLPRTMVGLVDPFGRVSELTRFDYTDHADRLVVDPGEIGQALAVFLLPTLTLDAELADYRLQIAEPGRWPAQLPLSGSPSAPATPQGLEVIGGDTAGGTVRYRGRAIQLTSAVTALEHGTYRAPIGQHLAVITVELSGPATVLGPLRRELWTLTDGKGDRRAIRADVVGSAVGSRAQAMELVFAYSTDATGLVLHVGPPDERATVSRFGVQAFE